PRPSSAHRSQAPHSPLFYTHYTPPTAIYTLSLHDALPIYRVADGQETDHQQPLHLQRAQTERKLLHGADYAARARPIQGASLPGDRKSTRLNSSHVAISYAVFCLKKKTTSYYD